MFGPRLTRIFASRWMALWWAATVLLLAWQIVPSPDEDADNNPPSHGSAIANSSQAKLAANPWALQTPATVRN